MMQFTITIALTAALVTFSAAAAVPVTTAVGVALPTKFTLTMTPDVPKTGTVLDQFPSVVTVDKSTNTSPMGLGGIDHPGLTQILFTGYRSGAEGIVIHRGEVDYPMMIVPWGEIRFEREPFGVSEGFVQVDGLLAFDAHDGNGPLTTWVACPRHTFTDNWSVWWAPLEQKGCQGITLKVVPS